MKSIADLVREIEVGDTNGTINALADIEEAYGQSAPDEIPALIQLRAVIERALSCLSSGNDFSRRCLHFLLHATMRKYLEELNMDDASENQIDGFLDVIYMTKYFDSFFCRAFPTILPGASRNNKKSIIIQSMQSGCAEFIAPLEELANDADLEIREIARRALIAISKRKEI